jgi:hypothetical protein
MQRLLSTSRAQAAEAEQQIAEPIERNNRGLQHDPKKAKRTDDQKGRGFTPLQRETFRREFTENDMKCSDDTKKQWRWRQRESPRSQMSLTILTGAAQ